jgi:hypothetical protein
MPSTGIEAAIKELEREEQNIQDAIRMLRSIHGAHTNGAAAPKRGRRKMSAAARRKISEAAKKRWAAVRSAASAKKQR